MESKIVHTFSNTRALSQIAHGLNQSYSVMSYMPYLAIIVSGKPCPIISDSHSFVLADVTTMKLVPSLQAIVTAITGSTSKAKSWPETNMVDEAALNSYESKAPSRDIVK